MADKIEWQGTVVGVQPRIRLLRSFDQRNHSYLGYVLQLCGEIGEFVGGFSVGIGKAAQAKHAFRAGDVVSGLAQPVADPRKEPVEFYKTSRLKLIQRSDAEPPAPPPWLDVPPELPVYRERGHRRLDEHTYEHSCRQCIWGCRMPVEIIIDQWNPEEKLYRFETFCYGPKSCRLYVAGPIRTVPGRKGMVWEEEDWVDEELTGHRDDDE